MDIETPPTTLASRERIIRPRKGLVAIDFEELWRYRELFVFLAWRDILVRYKQTYIGIAWAVVQPFLTMVVFTVVFGILAGQSEKQGIPFPEYAVMTLAALLPWQFFSNAMRETSNSVIGNAQMISKIYFPRLIVPSSAVLSGTADFLIGFVILLGIMLWAGVAITAKLLLLPFFFILAFFAAFGVGLWLSALNVKYRDVKYIVPFMTQMGLYISPVGFVTTIVPWNWRVWYDLNPMVVVIDGFRWCVLGADRYEPLWPMLWVSTVLVFVLVASGALFFRSSEKTFADVI